ncbi:hypothetical protein V8E54_000118 [Elaphomyces granulatus]
MAIDETQHKGIPNHDTSSAILHQLSSSYNTRSVHKLTHEPNFRAAIQSINTATRAISTRTYNRATILSLMWDNDDMGLRAITAELTGTFEEVFGFDTESFIIPSSPLVDATRALMQQTRGFSEKFGGEDNLLVVLYEGHAVTHPTRGLQILEFRGESDVLFIMDCCFATAAAMGPSVENFEYLVASARESIASSKIKESFSRRLIDLLRNLDSPTTVAQVHAKLVKQANDPVNKLEYSPVHVASAMKSSITLSPVRQIPRELRGLRQEKKDLSDGKVLVSVLVRGKAAAPDIAQWKKWLAREIPSDVADIKVEAVFGSFSALYLLTMPIAIWDMVKHNQAFSFIVYVQSSNVMNTESFHATSHGILGMRAGNVPRGEK